MGWRMAVATFCSANPFLIMLPTGLVIDTSLVSNDDMADLAFSQITKEIAWPISCVKVFCKI